jgi:hypothetical protein
MSFVRLSSKAVDLNDISGGFVVEQMQGELVDLFWPKLVR